MASVGPQRQKNEMGWDVQHADDTEETHSVSYLESL